MQLLRCLIALSVALAAFPETASAVLVDWSGLTWAAGSLNNSYDVDPANPGNDVTVTFSGDTPRFQPSLVAGNPQTPAITRAFDGGLATSPRTLELALNLTSNAQSVGFRIDFSSSYAAGVNNVSFTIFDIDFANSAGNTYQDVISSIYAISTTGTQIAPTITLGGANTSLTGSGVNQVLTGLASTPDVGAGSGAGNATITFNASNISAIVFFYGSGSAFADPTYQHIGIHDIDYQVVPESSALGACLAVVTLAIWTAQRRRKSRQSRCAL